MNKKICLHCKKEYEYDSEKEWQRKYEICDECKMENDKIVDWWTKEILSVPLEIRKTL